MPSLLRFALPALALASTAFAQCDSDITIKSSGDASSLSSCSSYDGTITIDKDCADDISLTGISQIKGDLVLEANADIKRIGGSDLQNITGELRVNDVQNLVTLGFPKLTSVGTLVLAGLPNLRSLDWTEGLKNCSEMRIENTKLDTLEGINLQTAKTIVVAGNDGIAEFSMQTTNVTGRLEISHNNGDLQVKLPNLKSANNATFRAISSIDLSSLEQIIKGSFGVYESESLESLILPNLTQIDGAFAIVGNDNLNNVSLPLLKSVSDNFQIANNTKLNELNGFPKLESVRAGFDCSGNITSMETPSLKLVIGVLNLQSEDKSGSFEQDCDFYRKLAKSGKGGNKNRFKCEGSLEQAKTANEGGSNSSSNKTGAASALQIQGAAYLGFAGLAAALLV